LHYLLDACALLALFNGEEGDDIIDGLLQKAETGEITLSMSSAQLLEVYYDRIYVMGIEIAGEILESILNGPVKIINTITHSVLQEAGRLKTSYSISFADSIGLATANDLSIQFVTSDGEFKPVEKAENIEFFWFRPPKPKK
jgi:predicted nucleic acid-binding protein